MNSKDEIVRIFDDKGGDTHPPAIFTQSGTVGQMDACGACWPEANFDADKMATLALQPHERFGFATARVPFCITVDADAFGCDINRGSPNAQPSVAGSRYFDDMGILDVPDDLPTPEDFLTDPRVRTVIDAAGMLANREDLFLVSGMNGPVACVNNLLGMDNVMMALMMEPERIDSWLKAVLPHLKGYASALSEISDDVMIIEEAASDIFPPEFFDSIFEPYLPEVIRAAKKGSFCTTHTCGDTMDVADRRAGLGQDGISLHASSDPQAYIDLVAGRTLMLGAVNPVATLLSKGPAEVVSEAKRSAELGFDIVTPECGVPPMTPDANLEALARYREL